MFTQRQRKQTRLGPRHFLWALVILLLWACGWTAGVVAGEAKKLEGQGTEKNPFVAMVAGGDTEARIDLGTVKPGSRHWIVFSIENTSGDPVTVIDLRSDCECLILKNSPAQLAAETRTPVKVRFDVPKVSLPFSQTILMLTSDPKRQQIQLHVKASIGLAAEN